MRIACYIPARLGSERVVRKNLRPFNGRPLIHYACSELVKVKNADYVCVNTESEEIASVARKTGISIYMRPPELSESHVQTDDIVADFIIKNECDAVFVVNPTAPFISSDTIEKFIEKFKQIRPTSLFSYTNIRRHLVLDSDPVNFSFGGKSPRTQDLKSVKMIDFVMCGFDASSAKENYSKFGSFLYRGNVDFFETPENESIDIDTEIEFEMAELLAKKRGL